MRVPDALDARTAHTGRVEDGTAAPCILRKKLRRPRAPLEQGHVYVEVHRAVET